MFFNLPILCIQQTTYKRFFPRKQDLTSNANCLHCRQYICIKCLTLKTKKNISKCYLLKILPKVLRVKMSFAAIILLYSLFFIKSICCRYPFELHRQVHAIQMGTHNICLYSEVDTGCNLKTTKLLDCALIRVFVVIRLNTVLLFSWHGSNIELFCFLGRTYINILQGNSSQHKKCHCYFPKMAQRKIYSLTCWI